MDEAGKEDYYFVKLLEFDYKMLIQYSDPIGHCRFTIKCFPMETARQTLMTYRREILPAAVSSTGTDSFGNHQIYGHVEGPHDYFVYRISGRVAIGQILYEEEAEDCKIPIFRHPYGLNVPGDGLRQYHNRLMSLYQMEKGCRPVGQTGMKESVAHSLPEDAYYEYGVWLMHELHRDYSYDVSATNMQTTAEEAWTLGGGVCQDYAHIFIALCHLAGIPARYVTGLIIGEGASHAWVEILYHNKWIGLDPTNDLLVGESHIKLSHGRHAGDCLINRGIFHGFSCQKQNITVSVQAVEE